MIMINKVRAMRALNARRRGMKLHEIAELIQVNSKEHARQLVKHGERLEFEQLSEDPWYELPVRVRNALSMWYDHKQPIPLDDVDKICRGLTMFDLKRIPNIGKKSINDLQTWLVHHGKDPIHE
jgi:hypothetical protein